MPDFDAIIIGSGMSGGWVAKELSERGLKVLVLERGRQIDPGTDYSDTMAPWERPNLDRIPESELALHYPVQSQDGTNVFLTETTKQFWVKDDEHPYETAKDKPFTWLRGHHTGGKSLMWGRQAYRLGAQDFEANKQDGHGIDWPIRYADLAPWYDKVERFAGISGRSEGLPQLPDSVFQPPFAMTVAEAAFKERVERKFPTRKVIHARVAHLTAPTEEQITLGRNPCQSRNYCYRGCKFGAYFSSVSATLPAAERTGNYTLVSNAVVQKIDYDPKTRRVTGVKVVDAVTKARKTYTAKLVFLNASTVASTVLLLNSVTETFPNGLANTSGQLGRNLIDHVSGGVNMGILPEFADRYYAGRKPGNIYVPRYANITEHDTDFVRGFGMQIGTMRPGWNADRPGIGVDFKTANRTPQPWLIYISPFGEMLPNPNNRITLHPTRKDAWGMPLPVFDVAHGANERAMMARARRDAQAMLEAVGAIPIPTAPYEMPPPGAMIHEMGTARMGADPAQAVINGWNQAHDVPNLFVTDGSAMASSGCQNPSLTYMALSARAAHHAADLLRDGVL